MARHNEEAYQQGSDAHADVEGPGRGLPEGRGDSPARKESQSDAVRRKVTKMRKMRSRRMMIFSYASSSTLYPCE